MTTQQQTVGELITEHRPRLKAFIRKRVDNVDDADDLLQDVLYQFTKTVETTANPIEQVSAWLYRVARNLIINKGIKKKESALPVYQSDNSNDEAFDVLSELLFDTDHSPETEYLRSLVWEELEEALSELPAEQREVFELTELDGLSVKDISETTGIAVNTLLSRKHYAVLHLRKRLKHLYNELLYT